MLTTDWFFLENNLYGGHISDTTVKGGIYTTLNKIKELNLYIDIYNREFGVTNRKLIKDDIRFWEPGGDDVLDVLNYFRGIISKCEDFLTKFQS